MQRTLKSLSFIACCLPLGAGAACYTVYGSANRIVYRDLAPPVDLSAPLGPAVQKRFAGGHLIITRELDERLCTRIDPRSPVDPYADFARRSR